MLSELLPAARIRTPLASRTKSALLRELVELAIPDGDAAAVENILAVVVAREAEISTGLGAGLAVPHGRTDFVSDVIVAAGLVRGVADYETPDDVPVAVAFLVLTPSSESGRHVKVLARIARVLHAPDSRAALLSSESGEAFAAVIRQSEIA